MSGTSGGAGRSSGGLRGASRAQSETIGVVLILGMVVLGMTAVIGFGSQALDATEQRSEVANAEQAMAQFDSKAAQVALGDSTVQSVPLGRSDGRYSVESSAGHITITHANYNGGTDDDGDSIDDGSGDDDRELYTGDFGAVVYEDSDTEIAYQGGGVWRRSEGGGSVMISPPEFHYRTGTLTLPVTRVKGNDASSGTPTGVITPSANHFTRVFPSGGTNQNPIEQGNIIITVESKYCEGWEQYFDERTGGQIDPCSGGDVVRVTLTTLGPQGQFEMLDDDNTESHPVRGLDGHTLNSYEITLHPIERGNPLASLDWSMYIETGSNSGLEFNVRKKSGNPSCGDPVVLSVYYSEDGQQYQGWQNDDAVKIQCLDYDGDGNDEKQIRIDFLDNTVSMDDTSLSARNTVRFNPGSHESSPVFDEHASDPGAAVGPTESLELLTQHYFALLGPEFEIRVDDGNNGNAISEGDSSYEISYTSNSVVRYLHVTDNRIDVKFE